jgi:hypothetical protein
MSGLEIKKTTRNVRFCVIWGNGCEEPPFKTRMSATLRWVVKKDVVLYI